MKAINLISYILLICILLYKLLRYAMGPKFSGNVDVLGLKSKVEIFKETETGIAHIFAEDEDSALFALGYSHAEDRLWQMTYTSHLAGGKLSELLGEKLLPIDKAIRNFGLPYYSQINFDAEPQEMQAKFKKYAEGINYQVSQRWMLPIEYWILGLKYPEFTPLDCILIYKAVVFFTTFGWQSEVSYDYLSTLIDEPTLVDWLVPQVHQKHFPFYNVTVLSDEDLKSIGKFQEHKKCTDCESSRQTNKDWYKSQSDGPQEKEISGNFGASNNWVIHGNHTKSGRPLMGSDPHLGNSIPGFWTINQVSVKNSKYGYNIGSYAPGWPFIVIGSNKYLTFASTTNAVDTADLYEEKIEGDKYLYNGTWHKLDFRVETIKVKGGLDVNITIRSTKNGPILDFFTDQISKLLYVSAPLMPDESDKVSIRWTGQQTFMNLSTWAYGTQQTNVKDFLEVSKYKDGANANYVAADEDGNIGFIAVGTFPI